MAEQSSAPVILLTRPAGQGTRFAAALAARFGPVAVVESPLMAPAFLAPALPKGVFATHIFSSETGVEAAVRLQLGAAQAACVGARTAAAAAAADYRVATVAADAEALVAALLADPPAVPALHLHGADTRGDIAARLAAAGIAVAEVAVYEMRPQPLSPEAKAALDGAAPVVVPLFSPRSARLFAAAVQGARAPLWLACLSPAVAEEAASIPAVGRTTAATPDAEGMLAAIAGLPLAVPRRGA